MPIYDYKCKECGYTFEVMQSMSAKLQKKCPKCKKNKLIRLIGDGISGIVKGSNNGSSFRPTIDGKPERIRI